MTLERTNFARWLIARSDVESARLFLQPNVPEELSLLQYISKYWPHALDEDEYQKVYAEAGKIEAGVSDAYDNVPKQGRFELVAWLMSNLPDCKTVLDYGASRGIWATHLHNRFGKKWVLYDIDALSIEEAKSLVKAKAKNPLDFTFHTVPFGQPSLQLESVDCAMLLEVLEHVQRPYDLLEEIERAVKPGGIVILSVPSGPVEYTMWVDSPGRRREHLREYTFEDLQDLLKHKQSVYLQYLSYGSEKYTGLMLGHFVVAWKKDGSKLGQISMIRKLTPYYVPTVALPCKTGYI